MDDKATLLQRVTKWFEKTGLPLELRTASAFKKQAFTVEHSSVYEDPQADKGREIDVIAHRRDPTGMLQFYAVAECKASPNPWLILANRAEHAPITLASLGLRSEAADKVIPGGFTASGSEVGFLLRTLYSGGYSMRQAFSSDNDPAYAAAMSALKAARALVAKQFTTPRFCFALPVLVVDAPIFECHLDESGSPKMRQVECTEFEFTAYIPERTTSVIRVVSIGSLPYLARTLSRLCDALHETLKPAIDERIELLKEARRLKPESGSP